MYIICTKKRQDTVTDICTRYHISIKGYYMQKNRYMKYRIDSLNNKSRKSDDTQPLKVTKEIEQKSLDLLMIKRFGGNCIKSLNQMCYLYHKN